jgi:homotetrameric cytidine deaminase
MDERNRNELIAAARAAMDNAYVIVNDFCVGAAVLTAKGTIYQGCNTQSVISGMGVCAERSAIDHAVACGEYVFKAIAVTSRLEKPIAPCGMCLQYIGEFSQVANYDIEILMVGSTGAVRESSISNMLPVIFGPLDVGLDVSRYRK